MNQTASSTRTQERAIVKTIPGRSTSDGAGVRLKRSIGSRELSELDPFLLLDEFKSDEAADYIGGFPDHPHRGFETVTYMLAGSMEHKDSRGNTGNLEAGSVQWMTAARGIIHSELPKQENGLMWGFQLWVNLPAAKKMGEPRYQDIPATAVPEVNHGDGSVRVIAGSFRGTKGAVSGIATNPLYLDVSLNAGARFEHELPEGHNGFIYVFEGDVKAGSEATTVPAGSLGVLGHGSRLTIEAGQSGARLLLIAGQPIGEPVARYGPFVMNNMEEIRQAFRDYENGTLA